MMNKKWLTGAFLSAVLLAACGGNDENANEKNTESNADDSTEEYQNAEHSQLHQDNPEEVPQKLMKADNPAFQEGDKVTILANHMEGMEGAQGEVTGAYRTTVYMVSYTPLTEGEPVKDYKWVVHEELLTGEEAPLEPGTEVVISANHREGMEGATAVIESAEDINVYMVDYTSSNGEEVTNYKWLIESELAVKE